MVHSISGWVRGVQVKLWDPLRTRAIPERLRGAFTTRRYTNPHLPLPSLLTWNLYTEHVIECWNCSISGMCDWLCVWSLLGYMAGQMVYQQDVSQSAGFVGQSAVSTGYSQMPARQHDPQVCGDCLEVKRNIIRTALCWVVWHNVHSHQHTHVSSSYRSSRLGLSHWDPYAMHRGGCLELYYCSIVEWSWWNSSLIWKTSWLPSMLWHCWFGHMTCKNRPRYDL